MEMLKNVYYKLEENHQAGLSELFEELEAEGICRIVAGERNKSWQNREAVSGSHGDTVISDALLITDDCRLAEQAETEGIACLGISDSDGYFAGAAMVLPDLLDVDVQMLRECYCHFHGIPATIAEDGRLILRELAEEDVDMLCRIGEEDGMEYAFCGSQRKAGFTPEVLKAYCKEQYRLYGYGLWGVFLKEAACSGEADGKERLIGCCGFAEASEHESGHGLQLELEYMLSRPYRHRGIGNEMCRMALQYAGEYLRVDTVWVQVHEKNVAGYALARKLGFHPADDRGKCKHDGGGLLGLTNQRSADMIETDS